MSSFADLGVSPPIVAALAKQGIDQPFPIQSLLVPDALEGRHVCGKANTGSGKTLAFAIPLAQRIQPRPGGSPRGLVLVPTRELALQVVSVLRPLAQATGLRVAAIYGGASLERQRVAVTRGVDLVVATPGRLIDLIQRGMLNLDDIGMAVIDEADRMADLGFLPQVEWVLRQFSHRQPQVLLFSATLDRQVDSLVRTYLRDPARHEVVTEGSRVDEMAHRFLAVHKMDRVRVAAAICRSVTRTIVFVRTKRSADRLAEQLQREGVRTGAIHGDLRQGAREKALADFGAGRLQALVATDVAARGIHVDDVDVVLQFDPPEDHKAYLHRSGRTARAGQAGIAATLVLWDQMRDVETLQKRLGLREPVVEVFSNDPRLADLASMAPAVSATG